jgi:hypothetical protein
LHWLTVVAVAVAVAIAQLVAPADKLNALTMRQESVTRGVVHQARTATAIMAFLVLAKVVLTIN